MVHGNIVECSTGCMFACSMLASVSEAEDRELQVQLLEFIKEQKELVVLGGAVVSISCLVEHPAAVTVCSFVESCVTFTS